MSETPEPPVSETPRPPSRAWALTSFWLGLVSLPTCGGLGVGGLLGVASGVVGLILARRRPQRYAGRGFAAGGIALSLVSLVPYAFLWSQYWVAGRRGEKARATIQVGMPLADALIASEAAAREFPSFQANGQCPQEGSLLVQRLGTTRYLEQAKGAIFSTEDETEWRRRVQETDLSACTYFVVHPAPGARFGFFTDGRRVTRVGELVVRFRD